MMAFVHIRDLWVTYGAVHAVRGISFDIPKGEVFGFIGPNGAGKTSTIKVLSTLIAPDHGQVTIGGISVTDDPLAIRKRIGYMPDFFGVYEDLTANEYLHFFAAAYDIPASQRGRIVGDVLALTDLTAKKGEPVDALSRGMKQRLGLARVLLHDPDLLLLDEPASGLDPRARIEIREMLLALKDLGKTILISSHILHELSLLCTRIGIIEAGQMVTEGSLEEIYRRLGLMQLIHVQLVNGSETLIDQIGRISGVEEVQVHADRLAIRVRAELLPPEELLDRMYALGARMRMFQPEAMELETAFMKLTEGRTA
jgi:ABC-2 type transport system ATP-binding protein